jgi:hypothetical protein
MTTRRLPLLGLLMTSLLSGGAEAQSQLPGYAQPSSRQSAAPQATPATASTQPVTTERSNWLKRLVIGQSEDEQPTPASVTFANPSSRQPAAAHGATTAPKPATQISGVKQGSPAAASQPTTTNAKGNWFQRLALGNRDEAPAKTEVPKSVVFAPSNRRLPPVKPSTTVTAAPATASKPGGLAPTRQPAPQQENGNWFKRLVVGDAKENTTSSTPTKTVQFAAPQPSSRQGAPAQLPAPSAPHGAQAATSRFTTAPQQAPQQTTEERPGWLRRLVVGDTPKATNSTSTLPSATNTNQAHSVASQAAKPRTMSGLFPPPQTVPTASQPNSLAGQAPGSHIPRALSGSQPGRTAIAESLNEANQSAQKDKIEPDSEGAVSLTAWISRLHRKPSSSEPASPPTNTLAPASVADRSVSAVTRLPAPTAQQPNAQSVAVGAASGDPHTTTTPSAVPAAPRATGNFRPPALAKTPNGAQMQAQSGLAAAGRNATTDNNNTLTGWLSRPFRSGDNANDELIAMQQSAAAQSISKAPVRLPAVTQTAVQPSSSSNAPLQSSAPAGAAAVGLYAERVPSAESASPIRFGNNVRLSANDASYPAMAAVSGSGPTNPYAAQDATNRVSPATGYQSAANPYQSAAAPMMMQPRPLPSINENTAALPLAQEVYEPSMSTESATNPLGRPKIIFNPVATMNGRGQATVKPTVQVSHDVEPGYSYPSNLNHPSYPSYRSYPPMLYAQTTEGESVPPPDPSLIQEGPEAADGAVIAEGPVVGPEELPLEGAPDMWCPEEMQYEGPMTAYEAASPFLECGFTILAYLNGPRSCPEGIGVENVMNAPFWIDTTQPLQNCRIRGDAAADWEFPDRIEYFWPKVGPPKGPQLPENRGEPPIDYQEVSFYIERGGDRFSIGTDLPIRAVDPVIRRNTTGFADMRVTTKTVLLDGKDWQLTQILHTHINTGSFRRGTGNGHMSLEPGVAWRYKWSDVTYFHGDLTYWFPIAADPNFSGQMFNYGIGISHIWIDTDKWALMPTLELNAWTILDGRQTFPFEVDVPTDPRGEIDTLSILNIHPGLRWVCDTAGDCGVREFGISSGIAVTEDHWYEEILRLELRWVF